MILTRKEKVKAGFMSVVPFIAALFIMLLVSAVASTALSTKYTAEWINARAIYIVALTHVFMVGFFGIWYFLHSRTKREAKLRDVFGIKLILSVVFIAVGLQFLSRGWLELLGNIWPSLMESYGDTMQQAGLSTLSPIVLIAVVGLAPIGEELIFRGMTIHYLEKTGAKFWLVNIIQAFLFAVLHMNLVQGSYAFVLGLVLGFIANKYQSVIPCMLTHFCYNLLGVIIPNFFGDSETAFVISIVVSVILVIIAAIILHKEKKRERVISNKVDVYSYYEAYTPKVYRVISHVIIPFVIFPLGGIAFSIPSMRAAMVTLVVDLFIMTELLADYAAFGGSYRKDSPVSWIKTSGYGLKLVNTVNTQDIIIKLVKYAFGWIFMGAAPLLAGQWQIVLFGFLTTTVVSFLFFNVTRILSIPQYMTVASIPALLLGGGLLALYSFLGEAGLDSLVILMLVLLAVLAVVSVVIVYVRNKKVFVNSFADDGVIKD